MSGVSDSACAISEERQIRSLLMRLPEPDLIKLCKRWKTVGVDDQTTKSRAIKTLLAGELAKGLNNRRHGELELMLVVNRPESKMWHVCSLVDCDQQKSVIQPHEFERVLSQELSLYFHQHTTVRSIGGVTWARIGIDQESWRDSKPQSLFLVHQPRSGVVLHSQTTKTRRTYLLGALRSLFQCSAVVPQSLEGRNIASLLQLCLAPPSRWNSASLSKKAGGNDNPLEAGPQTRRKRRQNALDDAPAKRATLMSENSAADEERREAADELCGVEDMPAALQRVEFKVGGTFRGPSELQLETRFPMLVRMEGPNVLDGIKQLVAAGSVELPLPSALSTLLDNPCGQLVID